MLQIIFCELYKVIMPSMLHTYNNAKAVNYYDEHCTKYNLLSLLIHGINITLYLHVLSVFSVLLPPQTCTGTGERVRSCRQ